VKRLKNISQIKLLCFSVWQHWINRAAISMITTDCYYGLLLWKW